MLNIGGEVLDFIKNPGTKASLFSGVFAGLVIVICEWLIPNISYVSLAIVFISSVILGFFIGSKIFEKKPNEDLPK